MSPIYYLNYNTDPVGLGDDHPSLDMTAIGWVDDAAFLTTVRTVEESTNNLKAPISKALLWARTPASQVDSGKFRMVHFTNAKSKPTHDLDIQLPHSPYTVKSES